MKKIIMSLALIASSLSPLFSINLPSVATLNMTKEFVTAAACGDVATVRTFLKKGIFVDVEDDGATALFCAARNGHSTVVFELIKAGANIERAHSYSRKTPDYNLCATPLAHAIWSNDVATVNALLNAGARVDIRLDGENFGILHCVVSDPTLKDKAARLEILKLLLAAGAPLTSRDRNGNTPLMLAASQGHLDLVQALLQAQADPNVQNFSGKTALMLVAQNCQIDVAQALITAKADTGFQDKDGKTFFDYPVPQIQITITEFMNAAKNGDLTKLKKIIPLIRNRDIRDKNNMTALMYAAEKNHPEVVKLLINNGADIEACHYRATALVYAVYNGNMACVRALLDAKAKTDICLRFNGNQGILHLIPKGNVEILHMLIQAGAPLNQTDDGGHTPLMWAVLQKDLTFLTILLNAGANPNLALPSWFESGPITPLMAAAENGFTDGIKALLTAGANKNLKNKSGKTALDYAATEEIKILLQTT